MQENEDVESLSEMVDEVDVRRRLKLDRGLGKGNDASTTVGGGIGGGCITNYELMEYLKRREQRDEELFKRMDAREERLLSLLERTVVAIEALAAIVPAKDNNNIIMRNDKATCVPSDDEEQGGGGEGSKAIEPCQEDQQHSTVPGKKEMGAGGECTEEESTPLPVVPLEADKEE